MRKKIKNNKIKNKKIKNNKIINNKIINNKIIKNNFVCLMISKTAPSSGVGCPTDRMDPVEEAWFAGSVLVRPVEGVLLERHLDTELRLVVRHPRPRLLHQLVIAVQLVVRKNGETHITTNLIIFKAPIKWLLPS